MWYLCSGPTQHDHPPLSLLSCMYWDKYFLLIIPFKENIYVHIYIVILSVYIIRIYMSTCIYGPWAQGHLLIWDATCWNTMAASNIHIVMSGPGWVADMATSRKRETYWEILHNHHFVPAAVETMGSFGEDMFAFLHQVASHIQAISKDPLEYLKLCQRFSVCIQNFNSASILGCCTLV